MRVSNQTEFEREVKSALRKLGKRARVRATDASPEAVERVAEALNRAGIKAAQHNPYYCPLAQFLKREIPGAPDVAVYEEEICSVFPDGSSQLAVSPAPAIYMCDLPIWVSAFVRQFDHGRFEYLVI